MAERIIYEVLPNDDRWELRRRGTNTGTTFDTKDAAIQAGMREASRHELGQLVVRTQDGKIEEERTYGEDPERFPG